MKENGLTLVVSALLALGMLTLAFAISWLAYVLGGWVTA